MATTMAAGCARAAINLRNVQRIETEGRFVFAASGQSPTIDPTPVVIEGDRLRALVAHARCRDGSVVWKGGIPATLVMRDGSRRRVDGFSFYGGFLRIHGKQWCELDAAAWAGAWQAP
jgi:hypothetical protein